MVFFCKGGYLLHNMGSPYQYNSFDAFLFSTTNSGIFRIPNKIPLRNKSITFFTTNKPPLNQRKSQTLSSTYGMLILNQVVDKTCRFVTRLTFLRQKVTGTPLYIVDFVFLPAPYCAQLFISQTNWHKTCSCKNEGDVFCLSPRALTL